jgi:hypothetical protein
MKIRHLSPLFLVIFCTVAHAAPGVITYAVIGSADPNKKLPMLDGVPGAGVSNVDVAMPVYILKHGVVYEVTIGVQNYTYAGTCVVSYALGAGATGGTNISNYSTSSYSCPASTLWTFPFPVAVIPNMPGAALLTATVTFGTTTVVTKTPLMIQ